MIQRPLPAYPGAEPDVLVCYSHEDRAQVYPELIHLRKAGFSVWYGEGISSGSEWSEALAEAIEQCAVFIFCVTPSGVASPIQGSHEASRGDRITASDSRNAQLIRVGLSAAFGEAPAG